MKKSKNILILGYGVSGKSAAKVSKDLGLQVYIYDDKIKTAEDVKSSSFDFVFNKEDLDLYEFDIVMKSPGIHLDNPVVEKLSEKYNIISDIELAYLFNPNKKIIAVTGTNGKTTTTLLINKMLNDCGLESVAGGNIGYGAVEAISDKSNSYVVLECSSYQILNIDKFKPEIAVITNIESDHLDFHKSQENYEYGKINLLRNLGTEDFVVLNFDDPTSKNKINGDDYDTYYVSTKEKLRDGFYLHKGIIYFGDQEILKVADLQILGNHNYYNVMEALAVGKILNLNLNQVLESLKAFQGVEHRLEFVKEENNVSYYNDSKATNVASTRNALNSFDKDIILILGGYDKGEDFSQLISDYSGKINKIYTFGSNSNKVLEGAKAANYRNIEKCQNLKETVAKIKGEVRPGQTVLFSPASASLDMYDNFEVRGKEFKDLI